MLNFLSGGESHGKALVGILEGFPKGVRISLESINRELQRRQSGFGRGKRMAIEKDEVEVLSGLRAGVTLGSPIAFLVRNKDAYIEPFLKDNLPPLTIPRPAHADLPGALKYQEKDIRNILERASARETVIRVVAGSFCKQLLREFKIEVLSHTVGLGKTALPKRAVSLAEIRRKTKDSLLNCVDRERERRMLEEIKKAQNKGDSLGGVVEIVCEGLPFGLGSFMSWRERLDARLSYALMSIPAVKGVEIGLGFDYAQLRGSQAHDEIFYSKNRGFYYKTNNSGGIVGGISTSQPIVVRIAMKPIATLKEPLSSVDLITHRKKKAPSIRSDVTAVVACGVIAEAMTAFIIAQALLEKFPSDTLSCLKKTYNSYLKTLKG
ncbi:MAG TPA: chorismate synthase [Candidatus Omnitrophica bacterium]|nr:MAG: chorismate synthase [Candidatus Omnitrophota bacterium]RKY35510.1 MAG: chorismate synthase [Candidatus Omnitrophota bacterium]RKY45051.1 MAG: chorismate synthase [Candidatus Omnitrophota bacterium]HEC69736.1 chorismate synthase [Candidatus Omnitrophota bacterium]